MSEELPLVVRQGHCHLCHNWTWSGVVVAEIHSDSGAGATIVRCAACWERRRPGEPAERPLPAD